MKFKDLKLILFRRFRMPKEYALRRTWNGLTIAEKAVFSFLAIIFSLSSLYLVWQVNGNFLIEVPTLGGTLTEGIIGNPRFINPVLAISEADRNLSALVYSGLVHISPKGEIENELADTIDISPDRRVYTVHISRGAKFHDGEPITADDVIFTIQKIVDPNIKSPKRGNWDGISVTKIDEETVSFNLKQTYAPFIYNLAIGIIPKHIWKNVSDDEFTFSQFNTIPVGSGPYQVEKVERNSGGIPDMYQLSPFDNVPGKKILYKKSDFQILSERGYSD